MLSTHEHQLVADCLASLASEVDLQHPNQRITEELFSVTDDAASLLVCDDVDLIDTYPLFSSNAEAHIVIAKISTSIRTGRSSYSGAEPHVIGIKRLRDDYGHILIRSETMVDKLAEFIRKTELDFKDYPGFCTKYFYMSQDETLGYQFATHDRIISIEAVDDLVLEVIGKNLIMRFPRVINKMDCEMMLRLLKGL